MVLLDTGADVSCMSYVKAEQFMRKDNNLKLEPSSKQNIKCVGGQHLNIRGQLQVEMNVNGLQITQIFQVVGDLNLPVVLGVDFLTSHAAQIDFSTKNIVFVSRNDENSSIFRHRHRQTSSTTSGGNHHPRKDRNHRASLHPNGKDNHRSHRARKHGT